MHQSFSSLSRIRTVLHTYSKIIIKEKEKNPAPCNLQLTSRRSRASSDSSVIAQSRRAVRQHRPLAGVRLGLVYLSLTQLGVGVGVSNTRIDTDTDTDHRHRTRRRTHLDRYSYVPHGARSQCQSVHTVLTSPGSSTSSLQYAQHICAQMYGMVRGTTWTRTPTLHCATLHYTTLHRELSVSQSDTTQSVPRTPTKHRPVGGGGIQDVGHTHWHVWQVAAAAKRLPVPVQIAASGHFTRPGIRSCVVCRSSFVVRREYLDVRVSESPRQI